MLALLFYFCCLCPMPTGVTSVSFHHQSLASATRLDLNRATAVELERLPGIGKVLAQRIVEHRQKYGAFRRPQDVIIVRGMSARRYRAIASFIRT